MVRRFRPQGQRLGPEDGVFIRVGSTNRKAEALQIEELNRLNWRTTFDEQAIPDLKSDGSYEETQLKTRSNWRSVPDLTFATARASRS